MDLWERAFKTDPKRVKQITGKQYQGNSPSPYWIVQRLTEEFGPCGIGWGTKIISERMERLSEHDVLHVAHIKLWYVIGEKKGEIEQVGQTKAAYMTSSGKMLIDEDAPKKSVTDALVKCASYMGFAGDIFSGRWDDSKYVSELREEFSRAPPATAVKAGVKESLSPAAKPAAPRPPPMPETVLADWIAAISAASEINELRALNDDAVKSANTSKDEAAYKAIRAAVKARAKDLGLA